MNALETLMTVLELEGQTARLRAQLEGIERKLELARFVLEARLIADAASPK